MEEILYNLLSNAIKHTPDGGSITLDVMEQEKGVSIHITDSGTGMTEEVKNIFSNVSIRNQESASDFL